MIILITGGAGFIGSAIIRQILEDADHTVVNVDKLTYASNLKSLESVSNHSHYTFEKADINDYEKIVQILDKYQPDAIMNLAAESHVDRSIDGPAAFIQTNVIGTYTLLEATRNYYKNLPIIKKNNFRFHHISTDEVYGDLEQDDRPFDEFTAYAPNSPYSSTKASSDHLVRAWYKTYNLPVLITNCSNNYGPYQHPEKLIPHIILNAIEGRPLPVYGNGENIRDWLYVEDHAKALLQVLENGRVGETYNIGANNEKQNIVIVEMICDILGQLRPLESSALFSYRDLITYVEDRPGHDKRYAINTSKIEQTIGWKVDINFDEGLYKTVEWYLKNRDWCESFQDANSYKARLGLKA